MKHLFIINPAAGSHDRTEEYSAEIRRLCGEKGLSCEIRVSAAPGDAARIAREAAETGEELRIYACGGDGTLKEVAAGAAGHANAAVTVFSGGSGNDFVKLFSDPKAFFSLERLLDAEEVTFDMIRCNDDLALNICSVGLDARIASDVSRYKRIPLLQGFRAYLASTAVNLVKGISEPYVVEINGQRFDGEFTFVCVCSGRYYGGGFNPIPEADPSDGMLDVLLVDKVSLLQVPGLIGKYKNGQYKKISHVARYLQTDCVKVFSKHPTAVNMDGETFFAREVVMKLAEEKLRFFYPRGLTWKNAECAVLNTK